MRPSRIGRLVVALGCWLGASSFMVRPQAPEWVMPGEFEPHDAVWLGWNGGLPDFWAASAAIIDALQGHVPVIVGVRSDSLLRDAQLRLWQLGIDTTRVTLRLLPGDGYWIRDHGATFVRGADGRLGAVDFEWNSYGIMEWLGPRAALPAESIAVYEARERTGVRSRADSVMGAMVGASAVKSRLVIEGGAIESNGRGTIIQTESVTLQRNPGWTRDEIEAEYRRVLGARKVIWLKEGLVEDGHIVQFPLRKYVTFGTGGHVDEFVRFADDSTILLAWVDEQNRDAHPLDRLNDARLRAALAVLERATDQDGRRFRILKVPLPSPVERRIVIAAENDRRPGRFRPSDFLPAERPAVGDTLIHVAAASYLNFLVTNGVVVNATYVGRGTPPEREARVRAILARAFPGRAQRWLDVMPLNWAGGGIHCSTQQQPGMRK